MSFQRICLIQTIVPKIDRTAPPSQIRVRNKASELEENYPVSVYQFTIISHFRFTPSLSFYII